MELTNILKDMVNNKASDIILKVGSQVCMRINTELRKDGPALTEKDLDDLVNEKGECRGVLGAPQY